MSNLTLREAIELLKDPLAAEFSDRLSALEARIFRLESAREETAQAVSLRLFFSGLILYAGAAAMLLFWR